MKIVQKVNYDSFTIIIHFYFLQVLGGPHIPSKVVVSQGPGVDVASVESSTYTKENMFSSTSSTTTTHSKASTSYTSSASTMSTSITPNVNGSSNAAGPSDTPRRQSRDSIIQQMLRQQSENKSSTKDSSTAYSSIFSGTQQSAVDSTTRKSSIGIGAESSVSSSNPAPIISRRKRPDWAEPTVSVDQAAILKASLERKGENTAEKINCNLNSRRKSNSRSRLMENVASWLKEPCEAPRKITLPNTNQAECMLSLAKQSPVVNLPGPPNPRITNFT